MKKKLARGKTGRWRRKAGPAKVAVQPTAIEKVSKKLNDGVRYVFQEIVLPYTFTYNQHIEVVGGFSVVPVFNPSGTTIQQNPQTSRKGNKLFFKKVVFKFCVLNQTQYGTCIRLIFFRNTNQNELLNQSALSNLFQSENGSAQAPNQNGLDMPTQRFNPNLIKSKSDLLMDVRIRQAGSYYATFDSQDTVTYLPSGNTFGTLLNKTVNINQVIDYENAWNSTQIKNPPYYLCMCYANNANVLEPTGQQTEIGVRALCTYYEA